jgi:hypothetical protein
MLTPPLSHEQRKIVRKKIKKRFWLCGEKEIDSRKIIVETERFSGLGSISLHTLESNKMYAHMIIEVKFRVAVLKINLTRPPGT